MFTKLGVYIEPLEAFQMMFYQLPTVSSKMWWTPHKNCGAKAALILGH